MQSEHDAQPDTQAGFGLIDTHAHVYHERFQEDFADVLRRAAESGVGTVIVPATEPSEYDTVIDLALRNPELRIALGVHPHSAAQVTDADLDQLSERVERGNAIAIGEIGLDYYYDFAPVDRQHQVFRRQLRIAKEMGLPAVIHNRESDDDVLKILGEEQDGSLRFQLHCFSSGIEVLERALDLGGMISFTGNVTFKKSTLDEVVRRVPDDRLMIETDAPYMTPVPYRGKRNEPSYVRLVAEKIAAIRNQSFETIAQMTTDNARRFFALGALLLTLLIPSLLTAQTDMEPVAEVDTTEPNRYDRLFGVGGHFASSTILVGNKTLVSGDASFGWWISGSPLQPLGVDWLMLDVVYTGVSVDGADTNWVVIRPTPDTPAPPNTHNQLNVLLRFIPKPTSFINLHGSVGYTNFFNEYGVDRYIVEVTKDTSRIKSFSERTWGIGLGIGASINFRTPIGIISPTAEWHFSIVTGDRDIAHRDESFSVSQPRIGLIFYPALSKYLFPEDGWE